MYLKEFQKVDADPRSAEVRVRFNEFLEYIILLVQLAGSKIAFSIYAGDSLFGPPPLAGPF